MSGLGAASFVEGLQGGIAARSAMDRNKQFKKLRKLAISRGENTMRGERTMGMESQKAQSQLAGIDFDQEAFDEEWPAFQQDKDPALLRFGKWFGNKLGGMFGGGGEEEGATAEMAIATPSVEQTGFQSSSLPAPFIQAADGGKIDKEALLKRSYGEYYQTEEDAEAARDARSRGEHTNLNPYTQGYKPGRQGIPTSGGGLGKYAGDFARSASDFFSNTRRSALAGHEDISESYGRMANAEDAQEAGGAFTDWAYDSARSAGATAVGIVDDTVGKVARPVGSFLKGMLGFDGQSGEAGVPNETPESTAIAESMDNPEQKVEDVAKQAITDAKQDVIENFDYKLLIDQNIRPEELPSMSTKDWSDYRRRMTMGAMQAGQGLNEAHKMVDDRITNMQMVGWEREGQKALKYLQTGQNREAAMALRQAYQYFPNGISVKFGTMDDPKTGKPVIITMGTDEETGEPTGSPYIITVDSLNAMMEQMRNPAAFRTWTKDGHDLQIEINKLQSLDDFRQGTLENNAYGRETDRIDALSGGRRGLKASDRDRRDKFYTEQMKESGYMEEGFEDPAVVRSLASAMTIYEMLTDDPTTIVRDEVMRAYSLDPENGVQDLLARVRGQ